MAKPNIRHVARMWRTSANSGCHRTSIYSVLCIVYHKPDRGLGARQGPGRRQAGARQGPGRGQAGARQGLQQHLSHLWSVQVCTIALSNYTEVHIFSENKYFAV
jgi:hypothetical protein